MQHDDISQYLDSLVPERPLPIQQMETYAAAHNFPIIGPAAGHFCYQIARMIGARRIFELGSGYGYSTAWFARAVHENGGGTVYHTVWDEKLSQMAQQHLQRLGYDELVQYRVSEAVAALQATDGPFDLIFNDIDKPGYPDSLPHIAAKLRPGGVLLIDNMLWSGAAWDESNQEPSTQGIRKVTAMLMDSSNWLSSLVPIRDGLIMAIKVGN